MDVKNTKFMTINLRNCHCYDLNLKMYQEIINQKHDSCGTRLLDEQEKEIFVFVLQ